jgi:hypothetical protein
VLSPPPTDFTAAQSFHSFVPSQLFFTRYFHSVWSHILFLTSAMARFHILSLTWASAFVVSALGATFGSTAQQGEQFGLFAYGKDIGGLPVFFKDGGLTTSLESCREMPANKT